MSGTLFVVGTPIGNLEDITLRALRTLREVDLIAAEDTRRTSRLLAHYEIRRPLMSVREHNEAAEASRLVGRLLAGESVALVSDAGTPGISDPGARLVRAARDAGVKVVPVPGPSAVAAALSVSGLTSDSHTFMGFPPASGVARTEWFERAAAAPGLVVAFESPHRIGRTLEEISKVRSIRTIQVYRELTKINEQMVEYQNIAPPIREQGEFTLILGPQQSNSSADVAESGLAHMFGRLTDSELFGEEEGLAITAKYYDVPLRLVRRAVKRARISAKRQNSSPA
jgi:16S rRNA (cytidine1402-2'-O)-methyltransferase